MFLGPVVTFLVATYVAIVALGHMFLIIAILKILHEDFGGGRRAVAADAAAAGVANAQPALGC
jgi:hypothetical protein